MAQIANAKKTYSEPIGTGGNREDLSDILYDVSPTDTPFITMCKKGEAATATKHEWLTDELSPAAKNAQPEAQVAAPPAHSQRVRLGNYTQIFTKYAVVSGSQEKVQKGGGIKSEMAYQVARRMKEIKMDLEFACIGGGYQVAVPGSDTTARELACFQAFIGDNSLLSATGIAGSGNGSDVYTPGTQQDFTEDMLKEALGELWQVSNGSDQIAAIMGKDNRALFSAFSASNTRYVTADERKLTAAIDVYDGDFHTVTAVPSRHVAATDVLLVDKDYVSICDLRPLFTEDLAKTGDGATKQMIMETTLKVGNPKAHFLIGDVGGAPVGP